MAHELLSPSDLIAGRIAASLEASRNPTINPLIIPDYSDLSEDVKAKAVAFVDNAIVLYHSGQLAAHYAAVLAVCVAAKHGQANLLTHMYNQLTKEGTEGESADQVNFRAWCKYVSTFTMSNGKENTWLGFATKATDSKPQGFFVKSGSDFSAARDLIVESDLKSMKYHFMDRVAKVGKAITLDDILKMIAEFPKTVSKKEEKVVETDGRPIPQELLAQLTAAGAAAANELTARLAVKSGMN